MLYTWYVNLETSSRISETEIHRTKNRIVAVDIVRILAALAVMYEHLAPPGLSDARGFFCFVPLLIGNVSTSYSCIFMVLGGYFVCRNLTWKKALVNSWWCFAPFILWNTVSVILDRIPQGMSFPPVGMLPRLYGAEQIVYIIKSGEYWQGAAPLNVPLWFMRDLMLLFLISPIIFKYIRTLFPVLLLMIVIPSTSGIFFNSAKTIVSPYALFFFSLGCYLRSLCPEVQQRIMKFYSGKLIVSYVVLVLFSVFCVYANFSLGPVGMLVGGNDVFRCLLALAMLYQIARWLEEHSKLVCKVALKAAPVTFLTFATHWPLFRFLRSEFPYLFANDYFLLVLPLVLFVFLYFIFIFMKRWCRPVIHLVAHYKLRPDDREKKPRETVEA